jgi:Tol biopolymer transport system component
VDAAPSVTPDGNFIVFQSERDGLFHIWKMGVDGGGLTPLTSAPFEQVRPIVSPDGKWVYYTSSDPGIPARPGVWKVPLDGGAPVKVSEKGVRPQALSPDGRLFVGPFWDENERRTRLASLSLEGDQTVKTFPLGSRTASWMPDGRLTYMDTIGGTGNLWQLPLDGSPPTPLTRFESGRLFSFAWSRDGRQLIMARGTVAADVVLITDVQNTR